MAFLSSAMAKSSIKSPLSHSQTGYRRNRPSGESGSNRASKARLEVLPMRPDDRRDSWARHQPFGKVLILGDNGGFTISQSIE